MNRLVPTVLRAALCCLPVAVGHCADALDDVPEIAKPWLSDQVVNSNTAMRTVPAGAWRTTLDLRAPDLQSVHVQTLQPAGTRSESDEIAAVAIAAAPLPPEESPNIQPAPAGIGSLYWAVRHPMQAWRIVLPIQRDDNDAIESHDRAAGRATPETLTEGRGIRAQPAPATLVHDSGVNSVRRAQNLARLGPLRASEVDLLAFPNVVAFQERMDARPAVQAALKAERLLH